MGTVDGLTSKFRLAFRIKRENDGSLTATMDSPDQGTRNTPVETVALTERKLVLGLAKGAGRFEGEVNLDSEEISGEWILQGNRFPLVLKRVETVPEISNPSVTRINDVIYGKKYGVALTMDVFKPSTPNGAGVIWVVSGGFSSSHDMVPDLFQLRKLFERGYTVFAVVHGSRPKYTIPEIMEDMNRAVRSIRFHASDYGVDPGRLGITGSSSGGHLALVQGTAGDMGNPDAKDPVEKESSRVQAVACFCPPTDFLNYGKPGENAVGRGILKDYKAIFDFHEYDEASKTLIPITNEDRITEIVRKISPIYHVTADDPPTLIIHGDADNLVPIQQSESIMSKFKEAGVPAKLITKPGAGHGWPNVSDDVKYLADWFDEYLTTSH